MMRTAPYLLVPALVMLLSSTAQAQEGTQGLRLAGGVLLDPELPSITARFAWFSQSYSSFWWDVGMEGFYNESVSGIGVTATAAYTWDWLRIVPSFYVRAGVGEVSNSSSYGTGAVGLLLEYIHTRKSRFFLDLYVGSLVYQSSAPPTGEDSSEVTYLGGYGIQGGVTWVLGEEW